MVIWRSFSSHLDHPRPLKHIWSVLPSGLRHPGRPRPPTRLSLVRPRRHSNLLSLVHRCDQCLCATRPVCGGLVQPFLMTGEIILIITLCKPPVRTLFLMQTHTHRTQNPCTHAHTHTLAHFLPWSGSLTSVGKRKKSVWPTVRGNM